MELRSEGPAKAVGRALPASFRLYSSVAAVMAIAVMGGASSARADDCGDGNGLDGAYVCGVGSDGSGSSANSAFGNNSGAFGDGGNTAIGSSASANGNVNTALGYNAVAGGSGFLPAQPNFNSGNTALGSGSQAGTLVDGQNNSTAVGVNARANAVGATALGDGAQANFDGSTAIGNGAIAGAANQVAIGTTANTYMLAGVNSQASAAAQSGSTYIVTTDSAGHLATSTFDVQSLSDLSTTVSQNSSNIASLQTTVAGHTTELADHEMRITQNTNELALHTTQIAALDTRVTTNTNDIATNTADINTLDGRVDGLENGLSDVNGRIDKAFEGTAMAMAMAGGGLPSDKNYAMSINWGTFGGENAFAGTAQARVTDNVILTGGIGVGASKHTVGGRAGVTLAW